MGGGAVWRLQRFFLDAREEQLDEGYQHARNDDHIANTEGAHDVGDWIQDKAVSEGEEVDV